MKRRKGKIVAAVAGAGVLALGLLLGVYWQDIAAWTKFVYLFESIGRSEQGYLEYRHRQTGIVMVRLPGGTFMMGTPLQPPFTAQLRDFLDNEQHEHDVTLSSFLIAKYTLILFEGNTPLRAHGS